MATDTVQVKITAKDAGFKKAMGAAREETKKTTKQVAKFSRGTSNAQTNLSQMGSAVSGVGFALGGVTTRAGATTTALGNMAAVFSGTGGLGVVLVAATLAATAFAGALLESSEAAAKLRKDAEKAFDAAQKSAQAAAEEAKNYGKSVFDIRIAIKELDASVAKDEAKIFEKRAAAADKLAASSRERVKSGKVSGKLERQALLAAAKTQSAIAGELLEQREAHLGIVGLAEKEIAAIKEKKKQIDAVADAKRGEAAAGEFGKRRTDGDVLLDPIRARGKAQEKLFTERMALVENDAQTSLDTYLKADEELRRARLRSQEEVAAHWRRLGEEDARRRMRFNSELEQMQMDSAQAVATEGSRFAVNEFLQTNDIRVRLDAAKARGDKDAVADLEEQRRQNEETLAARIVERVSMEAIGTGSTLVAKGLAEGFLGNPGGFAAAGIGAGLVVGGLGGQIFSGMQFSQAAANAENRAFSSSGDSGSSAPRTTLGPGTETTTSGPTIINYNFGGPVVAGDFNEVARTIGKLARRSERLGI